MDAGVGKKPKVLPGELKHPYHERKNLWLGLMGWLFLCYSASVTGDIAASPNLMGWYNTLDKPFFMPPERIFPSLWTLLYTTVAFSAWRLWMQVRISKNRETFGLFFLQLALNMAWPIVFFRVRDLDWAFIVILLLLASIAGTIYMFRRLDQMASYLLYPYILWVSFATILTAEIWARN